jgi:hypothetical protein
VGSLDKVLLSLKPSFMFASKAMINALAYLAGTKDTNHYNIYTPVVNVKHF